MTIAALDPADDRMVATKVAGVAALLVAKAHKLAERVDSGSERRLDDKDALDCLRMMQTSAPAQVGATLRALQDEPVAAAVTATAVEHLERLFARRGRPGSGWPRTPCGSSCPRRVSRPSAWPTPKHC